MKKVLKISGTVFITLIIILVFTGLASRDRVEIPAGFAGGYLDLGGEKIRYIQKGAGRDVLLIHGLPGSIEDWDPVLARLAAKYRVTAYDRPGFGYSSDKYAAHTVAGNTDTAVKLMEKLGGWGHDGACYRFAETQESAPTRTPEGVARHWPYGAV